MPQTALILGATGRFGRHAAAAFAAAGWHLRTHDRKTGDLTQDAQGADVIVNGWNPGYPNWARDLPRQTAQLIAAAEASGATILHPGNLYVYGAAAPERLTAETPHAAQNRLGQLQIQMTVAYRAAKVQVIQLRAGDYIDTEASGNWFDAVLTAKAAKGRFTWPGDPEVPHAFAWLPDLARAAVGLAARRAEMPRYAEVMFPGHTLTGRALAAACGDVLGTPQRLKAFPWPMIWAARPVWPTARGLYEMRYLWSKPQALDPLGFETHLPGFAPTGLNDALTAALAFARKDQVDPDQPVARGGGAALV